MIKIMIFAATRRHPETHHVAQYASDFVPREGETLIFQDWSSVSDPGLEPERFEGKIRKVTWDLSHGGTTASLFVDTEYGKVGTL